MRIYLDTSAFVKRYSEEQGSEIINEIFEGNFKLVTSHWTLAEAIGAIDKKVAKKQITDEEKAFILSVLFSDILDKNITFIKLSSDYIDPVIERILTYHISADDALQLFSCIVSLSPVFLASDFPLVEAAKKEGLKAFNLEVGEDVEALKKIVQR